MPSSVHLLPSPVPGPLPAGAAAYRARVHAAGAYAYAPLEPWEMLGYTLAQNAALSERIAELEAAAALLCRDCGRDGTLGRDVWAYQGDGCWLCPACDRAAQE